MKKYVVQSNKTRLYEEFDKESDARAFLDCHLSENPFIDVVECDSEDGDCVDGTVEYIDSFDPTDSAEAEVEEEPNVSSDKNFYVDKYINYCNAICPSEGDAEENIRKGAFSQDALDFIYRKYGCGQDRTKGYLEEYIKESKEKRK